MAVHRAIVLELLAESWHPFWGDTLPEGYVVHHMDFNPENNPCCGHNFIVMPWQMHSALQAYQPRGPNGRWGRLRGKRTKAPVSVSNSAPFPVDRE